MEIVNIALPDQTYKIAVRKANQTGIGVSSYISSILSDRLLSHPQVVSKPESIEYSPQFENSSRRNGIPVALDQIFDVYRLMRNHGIDYTEAVDQVARSRGVENSTVRDKCTRKIDIPGNKVSTRRFKFLTEDPNLMREHLLKVWPRLKEVIDQEIT